MALVFQAPLGRRDGDGKVKMGRKVLKVSNSGEFSSFKKLTRHYKDECMATYYTASLLIFLYCPLGYSKECENNTVLKGLPREEGDVFFLSLI